jgi:hypothetical protein
MAEDPTVLSAMGAARVLAPLLVTPDDFLLEYRNEVLGEEVQMPLDRLRGVRDLAFEIARLLKSTDPADWDRLDVIAAAASSGPASPSSPKAKPAPEPPAPAQPAVAPAQDAMPPAPARPPVSAPTRVSPRSPWATASPKASASPAIESAPPSSLSKPQDTASLDEESPIAGAELPFVTGAEAEAPAPVADEVANEAHAGETAGIGEMSPLAALAPMTTDGDSPEAPSSSQLVKLTMEQFASLRATLDVFPERRQASFDSYHIADDAEYDEIVRQWSTTIEATPDMKERFEELVARYREWLRSNG